MATNTYFTEYENLEIHELMLRDRPRQAAYFEAILGNKELFKDKIVMDVGAGTGILSAFCAKAGARLVYAIEASNVATKVALDLIEDNGLTDIVKVINSRVEEFVLPSNAEKVDIIVSEWMGFYLLHEGMLDSVLYARDQFLKEDGLLFPSECTIFVAPCSVPALYDDWNDVDGIKMTTFASKLRAQKSSKPSVLPVEPKDLLHEGVVFHWMNLLDVTVNELDCIEFKDVVALQKSGNHQGFCIWFEVRFPGDNSVVLSTAPDAPLTHWKQVVLVLPEEICENMEEREPVAFKICMRRSGDDARKYNLEVDQLDPQIEEHPVPCPCHMTKCILTEAHLKMMDTS